MSDPLRRYLAHGEELVLETRKSRAVLIGPAAWALLLLLVAAGIALIPASGALATVLLDAAAVLALAVVLRLGWTVLGWSADRVIVTDQRIFEISGVVTRRVSSMPLTKITDMTYRRGILGRLLGFGDFLLET